MQLIVIQSDSCANSSFQATKSRITLYKFEETRANLHGYLVWTKNSLESYYGISKCENGY